MARPSNAAMAAKSIEIGVAFANASTGSTAGHDRGPQVDRVEAVWGDVGVAYCAMGQFWDFAKAYAILTNIAFDENSAVGVMRGLRNVIASEYLTFSPSVQEMMGAAVRDRIWRPIGHGANNIMVGEYLCFDWTKGAGPVREHHIEQVVSVSADSSSAQTLGWNTTGGGASDESSNDPAMSGVHVKSRPLHTGSVMGWIGWRRGG